MPCGYEAGSDTLFNARAMAERIISVEVTTPA